MSEPAKAPTPAGRAATKKELPEHFKAYKHVWVFIEQERGQVHPVSFELLGDGRKLADKLGVDLAGVVIGPEGEATRHAAAEAFCYGADLAYVVADNLLADYRNEPYTKALTDLVNTYKPEILLLGATTLGRDLAGSVATTLLTGLTADCTALDVDSDGSLAATRPTFGGSLLCTIYTLNYRPQMATVRPRVMPMPERVEREPGRIVTHPLGLVEADIVTKVLSFLPDRESAKSNLALCRRRGRRRPRARIAGELPAGAPARRRARRRIWLLAPAGAEGLGHVRPADRPDRQDHPAEALYRRRHFRRDPASGRRRGRRSDRRHQHRQERADLRFRPCRHHHRCDPAAAGVDRSLPRAPFAAFPRPARQLEERAMIDEKFDAIVVGAGMAGNAAA